MFQELNRGNYEPVLKAFARDFEHWFIGQHALSGVRRTLPVTRQWYERLYRIFPDIRFELLNITVSGWPWDTQVTVEWKDHFTLHNGVKGANGGVHLIRLKWGQCTSLRIYCDTHLLKENLTVQFNGGIEDAGCGPLQG